jgi:hypothetical protein
MASSSKKQTTMAKRARELAVKERRARKQERKEAKKQAAVADSSTGESMLPPHTAGDETPSV